jgi:hypothetical protein
LETKKRETERVANVNGSECAILNSGSNPKLTPLYSGIEGKNIRRRRKRKSYDDDDEALVNSVFNDLVKIPIRVETPDDKSMTVPKYYYKARRVLCSITFSEIENPFVISVSDLRPYLITNLLNNYRKDYILYRVVERIIKNCGSVFLGEYRRSRFVRYPWLIQP